MRAKFEAVLALRQAHGFAFGKSDLFFCIALTCAGLPYLAGKASTGIPSPCRTRVLAECPALP